MHFVYGIFYALKEVYKQKMTSSNSPLKSAPAETLSFYRVKFMTAQGNIPFTSWYYKYQINCFRSTVTINNVARLKPSFKGRNENIN
jgi:hypothetical protein